MKRVGLVISRSMTGSITFSMVVLVVLVVVMGLGLEGCSVSTGETLEERIDRISRAEMESVAELLGHDLFEGRAPGTRGGDLAEVTMQGLCKCMDLDPGEGDSYYQPFVMKGFSNQGLFYRSDQFSFARYGIPSVWISAGEDELSGAITYTEFWGKDYHTVLDEFNPDWELEGMKQTIKYALLLIDHINSTRTPPEMKSGLPFPSNEQ